MMTWIKQHLLQGALLCFGALASAAALASKDFLLAHISAYHLLLAAVGLGCLCLFLCVLLLETRRKSSLRGIKAQYSFSPDTGVWTHRKTGLSICHRCLINDEVESELENRSSGWICKACKKTYADPARQDDDDNDEGPTGPGCINRWAY